MPRNRTRPCFGALLAEVGRHYESVWDEERDLGLSARRCTDELGRYLESIKDARERLIALQALWEVYAWDYFFRIWNEGGGDAQRANPEEPVAWLAPVWIAR